MKIKFWALGSMLIITSNGCARPVEYAVLPDANEVIEASIELNGTSIGQESVSASLKPEVITHILKSIAPATRMPSNPPRVLLGTIRLKLKASEIHEIRFFDSGQNPLEFSFDNVPYVRAGEFKRANRFSQEVKAFFPNEGIDLFHFLQKSVEEAVAH